MADAQSERPRGLKLLGAAMRTRKAAVMLGLGFASGLPFAAVVGTLNAWLGEVGVKLATIGVLSWIGLGYSFKFLWSPLVDRVRLPGLEAMGRRRSWIVVCQILLVAAFAGLAAVSPALHIGRFALIAFAAALASATQDIAIDGWRIDNADETAPIELLSALNQFGYRTASIVGGAFALFLAKYLTWPEVYLLMAGVMAAMLGVTLAAPDTPRPPPAALHAALAEPGALRPAIRAAFLLVVGTSWVWALLRLVSFMAAILSAGTKTSVADFTKTYGVLIVVATVFVPLAVAALANRLKADPRHVLAAHDPNPSRVRAAANHLYSALIDPLSELVARMGWGVLIVIGFILTYAICYNIWASFAYPFYLQELKYSKEEVAFASKIFGIVMTMAGISLGGFLFARIGRFPTVLIGAVLPALGNFLYADLAEGGAGIDAFAHALWLDRVVGMFGFGERMVRLLLAICYENVSTGLALTAFVAYVSGIVAKKYGAIQYALLGSLVSLVGTLGRGAVGEAFDHYGYAPVFRWTALTAVISVSFVVLEWARTTRAERRLSPESRG